jgi:Flp pilus assembly protein CpaB
MAVRARALAFGWPDVDRRYLIGGIAAAIAAALVLVLTQPQERVPVLVAANDLPAGAPLAGLDLAVRYVEDGSGHVVGNDAGDLADWSLARPIENGEPIVPSMLVPPQMGPMPDVLAMSLDPSHAVLGELSKGDLVDVYRTTDAGQGVPMTAERIADGVFVVEARVSDDPADRGDVLLLLAVDDDLAALLTAAARSGTIDLVKVAP